jgi:hypothetical protein
MKGIPADDLDVNQIIRRACADFVKQTLPLIVSTPRRAEGANYEAVGALDPLQRPNWARQAGFSDFKCERMHFSVLAGLGTSHGQSLYASFLQTRLWCCVP